MPEPPQSPQPFRRKTSRELIGGTVVGRSEHWSQWLKVVFIPLLISALLTGKFILRSSDWLEFSFTFSLFIFVLAIGAAISYAVVAVSKASWHSPPEDYRKICPSCHAIQEWRFVRCSCGGLLEPISRWTVNKCPKCGYDMSGARSQCPECGISLTTTGPMIIPPRPGARQGPPPLPAVPIDTGKDARQ